MLPAGTYLFFWKLCRQIRLRPTGETAELENHHGKFHYPHYLIDDFPCDITRMRKFDYYSTDHTLGGSHAFLMYCGPWEKPDYECIFALNSACES